MSISDRFYSGLSGLTEALPLTAIGGAITYGAYKYCQLQENILEGIGNFFSIKMVDAPWQYYEGVIFLGGLTAGYLAYKVAHGILNPGEPSPG